MEKESSLSMGGANILIALFGLGNKHNMSQSCYTVSFTKKYKKLFSLLVFFLTVYDVTKKALYGRNMVDYMKTSKNNVR